MDLVALVVEAAGALAVQHPGAPLARFRSLKASQGFCCATFRPLTLELADSAAPTGPPGPLDQPGLVSSFGETG